ncbi:MAG TPA: DUF1223 domain-containing protein [Gammaproteobacteria bacterium]|nr:DUF1223 domain-containing protein [Gammaproteobacteria bacterium]
MRHHIKNLFIYCFLLVVSLPVVAAPVFESGKTRVSLLELYTSEGCSSCPPADRWLSGLKEDDRLWKEVVPVAFHVDYWNYIGWKDRFALPEYSNRQRRYARDHNVSTVYTPGFLLNGKEWRSFFGLRQLKTASDENVGQLNARLDGKNIQARFIPAHASSDSLVLNIAVLGFNLTTDVGAGENSGRTLRHDFTVLGHKTVELEHSDNQYSVMTTLPDLNVNVGDKRMGIALWINRRNNLVPLQATGGWLESGYND